MKEIGWVRAGDPLPLPTEPVPPPAAPSSPKKYSQPAPVSGQQGGPLLTNISDVRGRGKDRQQRRPQRGRPGPGPGPGPR